MDTMIEEEIRHMLFQTNLVYYVTVGGGACPCTEMDQHGKLSSPGIYYSCDLPGICSNVSPGTPVRQHVPQEDSSGGSSKITKFFSGLHPLDIQNGDE